MNPKKPQSGSQAFSMKSKANIAAPAKNNKELPSFKSKPTENEDKKGGSYQFLYW